MNDILVNFVNKVLDLGKVQMIEHESKTYSDKRLIELTGPTVETIKIATLTGLVDYVKNCALDGQPGPFIITIDSQSEVNLKSVLFGPFKQRDHVACVRANVPTMKFDRFLQQEEFIINLNAKFVPSEDLALVLRVASTVVDQEEIKLEDNGTSQRVTMKQGVAKLGEEVVKPIVKLIPFRTFLEVPQPESEFLFRIQKGGNFALFEADGGAWTIEAMHNIKDYLIQQLAEEIENKVVLIIN